MTARYCGKTALFMFSHLVFFFHFYFLIFCLHIFYFILFIKKILFIYLFIYGCVESSFLCEGFL